MFGRTLVALPVSLLATGLVVASPASATVTPSAVAVGSFIGCGVDSSGNQGVVIFHGNGTGLPRNTSVTVELDHFGTGGAHATSETTLTTSSTGAVTTPTHTGSNLANSDFGSEYLTVTIFRGSTVYGSKTASTPTCPGGGGGWKPVQHAS